MVLAVMDKCFTLANHYLISMLTGETLRLLRNAKGLKQNAVAKELDISQPAYSKWENEKEINKYRLDKIKTIFKCSDADIEAVQKLLPASQNE